MKSLYVICFFLALFCLSQNALATLPAADAGDDQFFSVVPHIISLDGSGSQGTTLSYQWTQTAGPAVNLSAPDIAVPTFVPVMEGAYTFKLKVDDGTDLSKPDEVNVIIGANQQLGCGSFVPGDINCSGLVDGIDLKSLSLQWLQTPGDPSADIAPAGGDNVVNMKDMAFLANHWRWNEQSVFNNNLITGRTVQVDTAFAYLRNRSNESIASELAVNGFYGVHYIVMDDRDISAALIEEYHKHGIGIYATFSATCTGCPPDLFPPGWEAWKMEFLDPVAVYWDYLSFVHPGYVQWYKTRMVDIFNTYNFDGFEAVEPYYPVWNGLDYNPPLQYADISSAFRQYFKDATGNFFSPNFTSSGDPDWYADPDNAPMYNDWVDFRVQTIVDFYNEVVNGTGGLRGNFPEVIVATWTLGARGLGEDCVAKLREWEGHDAYLQVSTVSPDVHYIQTHWPDWIYAWLPADYVFDYAPFVADAKAADPNVYIAIQTDLGSNDSMRRTAQWYEDFLAACEQAGIDSTTYYMLSNRGEVYFDPPVLKKTTSAVSNKIKLHFDQFVDPAGATVMTGRNLTEIGSNTDYTVQNASADGSMITVTLDKPVTIGSTFSIPVGGISDYPAVREPAGNGYVNTSAEDTTVTLLLDAD